MHTVTLHLLGYDTGALDRGVTWLMSAATLCHASRVRWWPLPRTRSLLTLLRSPHVNKKSRDQYSETCYGRMVWCQCDALQAQVYLALVESTHIPGVEITVTVRAPVPLVL